MKKSPWSIIGEKELNEKKSQFAVEIQNQPILSIEELIKSIKVIKFWRFQIKIYKKRND